MQIVRGATEVHVSQMSQHFHPFEHQIGHGQRSRRRFEFRYDSPGSHYAQAGTQNSYGARHEVGSGGRLSELGLYVLWHKSPVSDHAQHEERTADRVEH